MNEQEYRSAIQKHLFRYSERLRTELKHLLNVIPQDWAIYVLFEIRMEFLSSWGFECCPMSVSVDNGHEMLNGKGDPPLSQLVLVSERLDPDNITLDETDEEPYDIALDEIAKWISECWRVTGGCQYSIPAFVQVFPDMSDYFDMANGKWVDDPGKQQTTGHSQGNR